MSPTPTTFRALIDRLADLADTDDIYTLDPLPLTDESNVVVLQRDEESYELRTPVPPGATHVLEAFVANEAVDVGPRGRLTGDAACDAVAYRAAFDSAPRSGTPSWVEMHRNLRKVRALPPPAPGECRCDSVRPRAWCQTHPDLDSAALIEPTMACIATSGSLALDRCRVCGQHWQRGGRGSRPLLGPEIARVPEIDPEAWKQEPFASPSEIEWAIEALRRFLNSQPWEPSDRVCEVPDCGRPAIRFVTYCKGHFLGLKAPRMPPGRVYPPYDAMMPEVERLTITRDVGG